MRNAIESIILQRTHYISSFMGIPDQIGEETRLIIELAGCLHKVKIEPLENYQFCKLGLYILARSL